MTSAPSALVRKLGIRPGDRVRLIAPPPGYERTLGRLPDGVRVLGSTRGEIDFIQLFATRRAHLERRLPAAERALAVGGMLWVCWPKGASGVATDLDREAVRRAGLAAGLVDVKVCAVDQTFSGLKFVYRLKDR